MHVRTSFKLRRKLQSAVQNETSDSKLQGSHRSMASCSDRLGSCWCRVGAQSRLPGLRVSRRIHFTGRNIVRNADDQEKDSGLRPVSGVQPRTMSQRGKKRVMVASELGDARGSAGVGSRARAPRHKYTDGQKLGTLLDQIFCLDNDMISFAPTKSTDRMFSKARVTVLVGI